MKAITVRQPWAWLLFNGKPVENRDWYAAYRGPLAIHAAKGMTQHEYEAALLFLRAFVPELVDRVPGRERLVYGHVIGVVNQVGCVPSHPSPFFQGPWGHVYAAARLFEVPIAARGALGLWEWMPPEGALDAA